MVILGGMYLFFKPQSSKWVQPRRGFTRGSAANRTHKKPPQIEGLSKKIINERDVEGELHIEYFCQPTTPIKCCCDLLYILDFCLLIWICSESKASMVQ